MGRPTFSRTVVIGTIVLGGLAIGGAIYTLTRSPAPAAIDDVPRVDGSFDPASPGGQWTVATDTGSFVGYRAREMLTIDVAEVGAPNEAVGRTQATTGTLTIEGAHLTAATISADLSELRSDLEMRDGHLAEAFNLDAQPAAAFTLSEPLDIGTPGRGEIIDLRVTGDLSINAVTRSIVFPLHARWNGPSIQVAGGLTVNRGDFDLETGQFFFFRVAESFTIEVELTFVRACGDEPCSPGEVPPLVVASPSAGPSFTPPTTGAPADGGGEIVFLGTDMGAGFGEVLSRHIYRVKADGTDMTQLTQGPGEYDPTVAGDGRVAFGRATEVGLQLWILPHDGPESKVDVAGDVTRFDFSPDGTTVVAVLTEGSPDTTSTTDLVRIDVASGTLTAVTSDGEHKDSPDWSPDGSRLAFGLLEQGSDGDDIFGIEADGSNLTALTESQGYDYAPDWAPDGSRLVFARPDGLVILDLATDVETRLETGPANAPAWSPEGNRIAFESGGSIWIMNADGTGARRLDLGFDLASQPTWLPGSQAAGSE